MEHIITEYELHYLKGLFVRIRPTFCWLCNGEYGQESSYGF